VALIARTLSVVLLAGVGATGGYFAHDEWDRARGTRTAPETAALEERLASTTLRAENAEQQREELERERDALNARLLALELDPESESESDDGSSEALDSTSIDRDAELDALRAEFTQLEVDLRAELETANARGTEAADALERAVEAAAVERESFEAVLDERAREVDRLTETLAEERAAARIGSLTREVSELLTLEARLSALTAEAETLWPAEPDRIADFERWIADARDLVAQRDLAHELSARIEEELTDLPSGAWLGARLAALIAGLDAFADEEHGLLDGASTSFGWGVELRLEHARAMLDQTLDSPTVAAAWEAAAAVLAKDPRFPDLQLAPRGDLLPLGPDRRSGLLEFAVPSTGAVPVRDVIGRLVLDADSAAVVVLVPPSTGWLGAQSGDRSAPNFDTLAADTDGPVQRVEVSAHLIGKHELTQGQWRRLTGDSPSRYGPGTWGGHAVDETHPVTDVSWSDARRILAQHGLELPTEAQWESTARAGSDTPWSTGEGVRSLDGHVNLADSFAGANGGGAWSARLEWLDDGHTVTASIDTFRPNPFGLHNVHGNVWEWCLDSFAPRAATTETPLDPLVTLDTTTLRVIRGGAFNSNALEARCAHRASSAQASAGASLGVRIASSAPLRTSSE
jgi:formylglycine-generating enzyme required for sulfatase activity